MNPDHSPFGPARGFGLYVHWPYCSRICPYCDFNVYLAKGRPGDDLVEAIITDIGQYRLRMKEHPALDTVYFGGGTPALMRPVQIERILMAASDTFGIAPGAEITLEANPNDILRADLAGLFSAGVNRLSVGVQALRDAALAFLGRDHDAACAARAVRRALDVFASVSIDMIYARPGQSCASWEGELREAIALGAPHLSLYELTIEPGTAFGRAVSRGDITPLAEDRQADLYELTQEITASAGYPAYEISNHAVSPAHRSRHNLIYWNSGDWVGVGPGAHGRISLAGRRYASEALRQPGAYIRQLAGPRPEAGEPVELSRLETAREILSMGLRPVDGMDLDRIEALIGTVPGSDRLQPLLEHGWIETSGSRIRLTASGRLLADAITAHLSP